MHLLISLSALFLAFTAFYSAAVSQPSQHSPYLWIVGFILLTTAIYSAYSLIKPKIILRIDEQGIWERKSGLTKWSDISYYYTSYQYQKHVSQVLFYYNSVSASKEIKVDLSFSQYANESTIRRYITLCKGEHEVTDLGKS